MKLAIQSTAEADVLDQVEWYAQQGLAQIARRFREAIREALYALSAMPNAGTAKHMVNIQLAGLRYWPVKGFDDFRVYYLTQRDTVTVLRILHGRRDIDTILEDQDSVGPGLR